MSKWQFKSVMLFLLIIVLANLVPARSYNQKRKGSFAFRAPILRNIDKVELISIESRMGNIEKVNATKLVEGQEAQEILNLWRKQHFQGYSSAACHQPPYAIRFYSRGKVVLFASVCWMCHNVTFIVPDKKNWIEFDAESKEGIMLRELFKKAFPSENRFG